MAVDARGATGAQAAPGTEDVLAGGQLITNVRPGQPDTELRFIEPTADDGPFVCPACGAEARAKEA